MVLRARLELTHQGSKPCVLPLDYLRIWSVLYSPTEKTLQDFTVSARPMN